MEDKKKCPKCGRLNDITKFCIYCGNRLFSDDEIKLINDTPKPYCLNCGRLVEIGQAKCECGYVFANIKCPECETENPYFNIFCTSCGEKLWRVNVYDYIYDKSLFERHYLENALPYDLRNISVYQVNKSGIAQYDRGSIGDSVGRSVEKLKSEYSKVNNNLQEICSRWRIVSPNYCINCLRILEPCEINPDTCSCPECRNRFTGITKRIEFLKDEKNNHAEPKFDRPDLKWSSENNSSYLDSLAPSIGESQLEYRERLKWEFAENIYRMEFIKREIYDMNRPSLREIIFNPPKDPYDGVGDIMKDKKKCPFCDEFNDVGDKFCVFCGKEFPAHYELDELNSDVAEPYCLNCGRAVEVGQMKCDCGYEFADIECPHCRTHNSYTNKHCTSCGRSLWYSLAIFPDMRPRGCEFKDSLLLNIDILKEELVKTPHQMNGEVHAEVLLSQYFILDGIIDEICSRWWIVSPVSCISCRRKIKPQKINCPHCNVLHYCDDDRVAELKSAKGNYVECERSIHDLSNLKWNYKLDDDDAKDYFNSLAPAIGESQSKYRRRLFKEYGENSAISYLIKSEWNLYFEDICIGCGAKLEKYRLDCPSCGMEKSVTALSVLCNDDQIIRKKFPGQYTAFSRDVKIICKENGGDISYVDDGIVSCPKCSNYFHYLTPDFIDTHRCPHCGSHFNITAKIYQNPPIGDICPYCGREMDMICDYVLYGDEEVEECHYECPYCGHLGRYI